MRLSKKQSDELEAVKYFIPGWVAFDQITDEDIQNFFSWSDSGTPLGINPLRAPWSGLHALYYGKKYRDLHITSYLEDWGTVLNAWSFDEMPESVVRYIAKRMKKPEIIKFYQGGVNGVA